MAEKFNPDAIAENGHNTDEPGVQVVTPEMIRDYVRKTWQWPNEHATAFAGYADTLWFDYTDSSDTQTNGQVLAGMRAYWLGEG